MYDTSVPRKHHADYNYCLTILNEPKSERGWRVPTQITALNSKLLLDIVGSASGE